MKKNETTVELPRIWRSPYSDFGRNGRDWDDETMTANAVYTDEVLAGIAASGFNAIWVHGLLHHLVPSDPFPSYGRNSEEHLRNMRELMERAARHGLKVYIYMQPPRGFDVNDEFWKEHPEVGGAEMPWHTPDNGHATFRAVCTSTQPVKEFLRQSPERLLRALPELGGLILITASEYPSHCYRNLRPGALEGDPDNGAPVDCERCARRSAADVVSEIITLVRDGVRAVSDTAHVIAWNWSWSYLEKDPSPNIIRGLPHDVVLMADFERGDSREILGKVRLLDEYSLSFAGPSRRFLSCLKMAREQNLAMIAKLQLGTTHELASVPNLPLLGNLYEKARQMRKLGIGGFMGCWNFGNMITANPAAFNYFFNAQKLPPRATALKKFAAQYFPGCDAELARQAWEAAGEAMLDYPFSIPFIYMGPMNYSLVFALRPAKLSGKTAGRSWLDDEPRGDELSACLNPYTLDEVIRGMGSVARGWKKSATLLSRALRGVETKEAKEEAANAWVCYHVFRSTWNTFRVYKLRHAWSDAKKPAYLRIAKNELANLEAVLPFVEADDRFGYHAEAHAYLFDAPRIRKKISTLKRQIKTLER